MLAKSLRNTVLAGLACGSMSIVAVLSGCADNPYPNRINGDNAMLASDYPRAIEQYTAYLVSKPGEPDVRAKLGVAYMKNEQPIEAIENLRVATIQDPEAGQYIDQLADAYIAAGRPDEAVRMLRINTVDRGRVEDWLRLGRWASKSGDNDTAHQAFLTAARIDRGVNTGPQIALHDLAAKLGNKSEADTRLRMAYFCNPQDSDVSVRMKAAGLTGGRSFGFVPTERLAAPLPAPSTPAAPAAPATPAK